jgi:hypothetical protein
MRGSEYSEDQSVLFGGGRTEYCRQGHVLDAERFVPVLLYAQVAVGIWSVCTAWGVWGAALSNSRVREDGWIAGGEGSEADAAGRDGGVR